MDGSDGSTHSTCSGGSQSNRYSCHVTTGTRGDPRMHRAVAARREHPEISLFEALIVGGFVYDRDDATQLDVENVTLGQRKNQLSRRLRLSRVKSPQSSEPSGRHLDEKSRKVQQKCLTQQNGTAKEASKCKRTRSPCDSRCIEESEKSAKCPSSSYLRESTLGLRDNKTIFAPSIENPCAPKSTVLDASDKLSKVLKPDVVKKDVSGMRKALDALSSTLVKCCQEAERLPFLNDVNVNSSRKALAMGLYQADNRALYQRAMLMAGYQSVTALSETSSPDYLRFALACWLEEGVRLQNLIDLQRKLNDIPDTPLVTPPESDMDLEIIKSPSMDNCAMELFGENHCFLKKKCSHTHKDFVDALPEDSTEAMTHDAGCPLVSGRHVHRLEGKCGHKAILHKPENGPAHIDFVVGDTVECYQEMQPLSYQSSLGRAIWPSAYKCDDLSCSRHCSEEVLTNHKPSEACPSAVDPKVFALDEIDVDSKEWNLEFPFDESLLGLFKLGDTGAD